MKIPVLHALEGRIRRRLRSYGELRPGSWRYSKKMTEQLLVVEKEITRKGYVEMACSKTPLVSILIPVHNQFEYTRRCLNSIAHNTAQHIEYEVILVDDSSTDETRNIENHYPAITVLRNSTNLGFLKSINLAAGRASGKFIHLLNNDTIVSAGWLDALLSIFENQKDIGIVGSKLVYPDGTLQEAGGYITRDLEFGNFGKGQSFFDFKYNFVRDADYISGASLMIRRSLWLELAGFDEAFAPAYFEDTDLAMRTRQSGQRVIYQPSSVVFHFESTSYQAGANSPKESHLEKNRQRFLDKWQSTIKKQHTKKDDGFRFYHRNPRAKATILYIDEEMPNHYSCGSRLSLNYCKLLVEIGYDVKFLPMSISARAEEHAIELGQMGVETIAFFNKKGWFTTMGGHHLKLFSKWYLENRQHVDHVLLSRPKSEVYLNCLRKIGKKVEYLYHPADVHFMREERALKFSRDLVKMSFPWEHSRKKNREIALMKGAKSVLHVSTHELNYMQRHHDCNNGSLIPCLFFEPITQIRTLTDDLKDLMFIGGKHHASTHGLNWFIQEVYPDILRAHPDTKLHIIGDCGEGVDPSPNITIHGRLGDRRVEKFYKSSVAILPLLFGAGVKGKTLEAMFHGTPFVATTISLEGIQGIEPLTPGADTAEEFASRTVNLLNAPTSAQQSVTLCQTIINKHYSRQAAVNSVKKILDAEDSVLSL